MSVEQPKPTIITLEDINVFHEEKGVNDTCAQCGNSAWMILTAAGEEEIQHIVPQLFKPDGKPTGRGPKLIPLTCDNCGNVRLQHMGPIVEWKKANGRS